MESLNGKSGTWLAALGVCGALMAGCLFEGGEQPAQQPGPKVISAMHCADLTLAQQKAGDSLVALAQKLQASDVEMMVSRESGWTEVGEARAHAAIAYYDQALAKSPGHCGALLGRALAQGQLLLQDKGLNTVVSQAMPTSSSGASVGVFPVAQAFKSSGEDAAPLVMLLATGLSKVDKPFISAQQDRFADEVLPTLDSIIASLDGVLAKGDVSITFPTENGGVIEIDGGEVGPVLGGLKVARAVVLLLTGYQWEIAKDGSYDWMDRVGNLSQMDFADLDAVQRSDMDHLTGLFRTGSPFTRVKPAWKSAIQGIPDLLLQAVENTQTGLRYALSEAGHPEKQIHDVFRVGTAETDDIDPKELEGIIDALERSKKYLRGEVAVEYHNGTHTLNINFPKIFSWDGLQGFLPYHTVAEYQNWFPAAPGAWEVSRESNLGYGDPRARIFTALGLSSSDAIRIDRNDTGYQVVLGGEKAPWFSAPYQGPDVLLADLAPGSAPCTFRYLKHAGRHRVEPTFIFPDANTFITTADRGAGVIDMGRTCRVGPEGEEYVTTIYQAGIAPYWFTDAAGHKTLDVAQVEQVVDDLGFAALTGKIVFPDPTFGGVFPGLTNENIWSNIQSLEWAGARIEVKCDEFGENCVRSLPNNPSDLDVWARYLFWLDNLF
ncbi:MAG: hypothetical protein ABIW76_12360 [Fibrobacteria bacterium]